MEMQEVKTFKNAIESGLAAARNADRALDEVKGVFKAVRVAMTGNPTAAGGWATSA